MRKRVLYITNIEVPYRTKFFNLLAEECDLTVLFERDKSSNRNREWTMSENKLFNSVYLNGRHIGNENSFSLEIFNWIKKEWDIIIIGCCNSKVQIAAIMYMRVKGISFCLNLDGEQFIDQSIKGQIKRFILKGAKYYLTAGVKSSESLKKELCVSNTIPYFFSSLTVDELLKNSTSKIKREDFVLVIGQYFDYKGMDLALECAKRTKHIHYKFVGMGGRTELFRRDSGEIPPNVELIPFLQKEQLLNEYKRCRLLLLPSRKECWGLVVNEAASLGTPIVSTYGSGSAVEFLSESKYSKYLQPTENVESLRLSVEECFFSDNTEYSEFLIKKSNDYSIEKSVKCHMLMINSL